MVFPFARGGGDVQVFLEPREQTGQLDGAGGAHRARDEVELRAAGADQRVRTAEVDEQPALEEAHGVVGEQRAALDQLHRAFHRQLRVRGGQAAPRDLGFDGCGEKTR